MGTEEIVQIARMLVDGLSRRPGKHRVSVVFPDRTRLEVDVEGRDESGMVPLSSALDRERPPAVLTDIRGRFAEGHHGG